MDVSTITRAASIAALKIKQHSPTIFFVAGLAGVGTSVVLASKATLELEKTITPHINHLEDIADSLRDESTPATQAYTSERAIKDRMFVMGEVVFDLSKLYGPAFIAGAFGVACLVNSHNILQKRNAAITAAYVTLEKSYEKYRERVAKEIGEDKERELHYSVQKEIHAEFRDERGGYTLLGERSTYSRWYNSQTTTEWKGNRHDNLRFIWLQQKFANDKLHRKGYLFLNDVYEMLGLPVCDYGQVVGWVTNDVGDGYVDFGIFDHHSDEVKLYLGGINEEILLDFNVDGLVADKLGG
jgi:Family of unknown function (DUF6353)